MGNTTTVRVRFAPSPSGYLHVGGARTALFNWLFARRAGGRFILRIEDTDQQRSTGESVAAILEDLAWLGLDWDEGPGADGGHGPYFQSQRSEFYRRYAGLLGDAGLLYPCYCTPEELEARRAGTGGEGKFQGYDGRCRELTPADRVRLEAEGRTSALRLRVPTSGKTVVDDGIRGRVEFANEIMGDFVVVRADGSPTYNFAVVADDIEMGISHVIRGEDHLSNTPRQFLIYEALGRAKPFFAHIPLILGPDRTRLSKRHGATSVGQYREAGFVQEAVANYLSLLGWSYDDRRELFTVPELVQAFSLERVSRNPAVFDPGKLEWFNGHYLRELPLEILEERLDPLMKRRGLTIPAGPDGREWYHRVLNLLRPRVHNLEELAADSAYFFPAEVPLDPAGLEKVIRKEGVAARLTAARERLAGVEPFNQEEIEEAIRGLAAELNLKAGDLIHPLRMAVTGKTVSPGLFEVLALVGRELTLDRIDRAACVAG
ncbi:MAG: glutamate--tRNA ligase [Firmicutes bacterium]|nr:glutamate--tRNA ligase [Bacillota bacterium]